MWAFELSVAIKKLGGLSSLQSGGPSVHGFQKEFQTFYLTAEQFSTVPQSILNELWPRQDGGVSASCLHMASSCKIEL